MPRLIRALFTLLALLAGGRALAHEATMGVIEFREVQPGLYIGRWTSEPNIGAAVGRSREARGFEEDGSRGDHTRRRGWTTTALLAPPQNSEERCSEP